MGQLWHNEQTAAGISASWTDWHYLSNLGNLANSVRLAAHPDGRMHAVMAGTDDQVWHNEQTAVGVSAAWTGWHVLSEVGNKATFLALAAHPDGRMHAVMAGTDDQVWHNEQTAVGVSAAWTGWHVLSETGNKATFLALAAHPDDGRMHAAMAGGTPSPPNDDDDENNDDENNDDENNDDENNDDGNHDDETNADENNDDDNNDDENNDDENNDDENNDDEGDIRRRGTVPPAAGSTTSGTQATGRLTIVGTGITAVSQMSTETLSYIKNADVVFYHATNGVTATQIRRLSRRAIDLYEYYGNGKERKVTYVQMAELMLRELRRGLSVVGVFHGHPGNFVLPARRALAIAAAEGYKTALIPAISAPDCLFADLRVDPGVFGCQILMASRVFATDTIIATSGHVVFLQVSAVGDKGFSFTGYNNGKLPEFFGRLMELYGPDQDAVYYMAAVFPGTAPEVAVKQLHAYAAPEVQARIGAGMLYLPPRGVPFASLAETQAFATGTVYGPKEKRAVEQLSRHERPIGFPDRRASDHLFDAMLELGSDTSALSEYVQDPDGFVARFPELSEEEKAALRDRQPASLRRVTRV